LEAEDWRQVSPIATDPAVMRYITGGRPWTEAEVRAFVEKQIVRFSEDGYCRWKLIEKETGRMIGFCGLGIIAGFDEREIGWWLARDCWGKGLATEAATEALRDACERVRIPSLVSVARPENLASRRVMDRIGLRFNRQAEFNGVEVVVYSL
jgi:ribosomal-protein-alanine N-acetyltransferase